MNLFVFFAKPFEISRKISDFIVKLSEFPLLSSILAAFARCKSRLLASERYENAILVIVDILHFDILSPRDKLWTYQNL